MRTNQKKMTIETLFYNLGLDVFKVSEEDCFLVYCNKTPLSEICTLNDQICYMYHMLEIKKLQLIGDLLIGYQEDNCYIVYMVNKKNLEKDLEAFFKLS